MNRAGRNKWYVSKDALRPDDTDGTFDCEDSWCYGQGLFYIEKTVAISYTMVRHNRWQWSNEIKEAFDRPIMWANSDDLVVNGARGGEAERDLADMMRDV